MAKIYVFGIGGTGSRVLRSLTMMLAAGVEFGAYEIVPIIVDPDEANADLTRAIDLFGKYSAIRKNLHFGLQNRNMFFRAEMKSVTPNYTMSIKDAGDRTFEEFIDFASMSEENQAMAKVLFSDKNLKSSMVVGFKGNPNIGSVVLNQFPLSNDFRAFANNFAEGDKIFIISSIFGGTGASGFPLLLKTLRLDNNIPNHAIINEAEIGALTVLPYFTLQQNDGSSIDSSTFISKTKSALAYYENNIVSDGGINAIYYLGDDVVNTYDNHEGGAAQQNAAHLMEFLGATAIVDFSRGSFDGATENMEFGIKNIDGVNAVSFNSFYPGTLEMLYSPLTQFSLMSKALTDKWSYYSSDSFDANKNFKNFYSGQFIRRVKDFIVEYIGWLNEMKNNRRSLDLFNLNCGDNPFEIVTGVKPKKIASKYSKYNLFTDRLNSAIRECGSSVDEDKFLEMFFIGTQNLVSKKLNL